LKSLLNLPFEIAVATLKAVAFATELLGRRLWNSCLPFGQHLFA
jgi:hypothetical protein